MAGEQDPEDELESSADPDLSTDPDSPADLKTEEFARQIVLRRLTDQPRSRADLEQALAKKQVPAEVARTVLDRMEEVGLVDDAEFAHSWVHSRQRTKGLATRVLAMELRRKGIDDEVARVALGELDPHTEVQAAHRLVQKKLRSMRGLERQAQIRRLTSMLARKGYPPGLAFSVVREELDAEAEPLESL